jgi:Holliday junction DNA helicase RuvA
LCAKLPYSVLLFIKKFGYQSLHFRYFAALMIGYIEGKLTDVTPTLVHIDLGGLGYEIHISLNTYEQIADKKTCKLFTHLKVSEDAWTLYGFATQQERTAFQQLISVSGVGAATARILLSSITPAQLSKIIWAGDSKPLEKVKGIGAKTAQRILLELKGKLVIDHELAQNDPSEHNTNVADALNALVGLGIAKPMAEAALKKVKTQAGNDDIEVEDWIKLALKNL